MSKGNGSTRTGYNTAGGLSSDFGVSIGGDEIVPGTEEPLKNIEKNETYRAIKSAISRYHAILGVRTTNVKLAELKQGIMGVQYDNNDGTPAGVYLSKSYFKEATKKQLHDDMKRQYLNGWQTSTNKPVAHVVTHELAHATWSTQNPSQNCIDATQEIRALHKEWKRDRRKVGYGKYSQTNINEFFAEVCTKAVHGRKDKYTEGVKHIIKKYEL